MRVFHNITLNEMDEFLRHRGFTPIHLPNIKEHVYGRVVYPKITVRVYTGIVGEDSKERGTDAIRVVAMKRMQNGTIGPVSPSDSKVYRLENWRESLTIRINNVIDLVFDDIQVKREAYV